MQVAVPFFILFLFPMLVMNIIGGVAGSISEWSLVVRGGLHLGLFFLLLLHILFFADKHLWVSRKKFHYMGYRVPIVVILSIILCLSAMLNQVGLNSILRMGSVVLYLINILLLTPLVLANSRDSEGFILLFSRLFILMASALLLLVVFCYFSGLSPYGRLGYPLIPGVFAYYMLIAFVLCVNLKGNQILGAVFFVAVVMSGSRSSMALAIVSLLVVIMQDLRNTKILIYIALAAIISLLTPSVQSFLTPYVIEREDMSSGRVDIWAAAISSLEQSWWFGHGVPQQFELQGVLVVAHNSFLDLSLTYGAVYALLAYLVWLAFFVLIPKNKKGMLFLTLFVIVTVKSLLTNTFWTNMGDPATIFAVVLLTASMFLKEGCEQR